MLIYLMLTPMIKGSDYGIIYHPSASTIHSEMERMASSKLAPTLIILRPSARNGNR